MGRMVEGKARRKSTTGEHHIIAEAAAAAAMLGGRRVAGAAGTARDIARGHAQPVGTRGGEIDTVWPRPASPRPVFRRGQDPGPPPPLRPAHWTHRFSIATLTRPVVHTETRVHASESTT